MRLFVIDIADACFVFSTRNIVISAIFFIVSCEKTLTFSLSSSACLFQFLFLPPSVACEHINQATKKIRIIRKLQQWNGWGKDNRWVTRIVHMLHVTCQWIDKNKYRMKLETQDKITFPNIFFSAWILIHFSWPKTAVVKKSTWLALYHRYHFFFNIAEKLSMKPYLK